MRSKVRFRFALLAPLVGAIVALVAIAAPAAQAATKVERFVAANCTVATCGEEGTPPFTVPKEKLTKAEAEAEGYTQAGGHVPYGITDFKVTTTGNLAEGKAVPTGIVTHVRTDVAAGLATSPAAVPQCSMAEFGETELSPGTGAYGAPTCAKDTVIGTNKVIVYVEGVGDVPLEGEVFNLIPPQGRSSDFGVALSLAVLGKPGVFAHTLIEGNVEWGKEAKGTEAADYHNYFEINVSPALPLIRSRLILEGRSGNGAFITNATSCPGHNTTRLTLEGGEGAESKTPFRAVEFFTTPIGLSGCEGVPFLPSFALTPETKQQDQPDGITTELKLTRFPEKEVDSAQLSTAEIKLPEGLTINPSAAHSVTEACTTAQVRIGSPEFGTSCPAASKLGTVSLEVPTLPEPLTGNIYLGGEGTGATIAKPPYTIYLDAQTTRYGVDVRLKGTVTPNATTGRLTATFTENPEQPFTNLKLSFNTGPTAPLANSLTCGTATTETSLSPFTGTPAQAPSSVFTVDSNNAGGACASPVPFALTQTTANQATNGGANTSYTLNIARADGQQYLSQISTTLPAGLVGLIPTVTQCGEAEATAGTCTTASKIGVVGVTAGAGATPYGFSGNVYLTGPYNGAPFGLSIVVPAIAGPFNLGNVITRGTLTVNPYTARVTATSTLPTIVGGIPLRLKTISVSINRQGFLVNPTNCGALATETTLTGFSALGSPATATQTLSTPFQVGACGGLSFKPSFKSKTSAKTSKANGASLETTLNIGAGQTNFKSVMVQLPKQLPSRLTTLQKACPEAVFNANPYHCPSGSFVGGARANTPTLPGKLQGPAIFVSHGGAAFPDLDLVMEANGVRVILVGNTKISKGVTTTTFASPPDVPVSSITVNLPIGGHSAVTANGSLCINPLTMPTTLTGQNGFVVKQNTKLTVASCGVRIAGKKVIGNTAYITVQTYSAGRISGSGSNLKTVYRHLNKAQKTATLQVPLSNGGLRRGKPFKVKLRVGFVPKTKSVGNSASTTTVVFG